MKQIDSDGCSKWLPLLRRELDPLFSEKGFFYQPEYILQDLNMQTAFDIYMDITEFVMQLQESAFDVIMKLPSLDCE